MRIPLWAQARVLLIVACYSFLIFPLLPVWAQGEKPQEVARPYTVQKGDTLWDIAARELDDPLLWPRLWVSDPAITNPDLIYPGDRLFLVPEAIPLVTPEVLIPEVPPPVEEVTPETPIPEAPPVEEVTPEVPIPEVPPPVEEVTPETPIPEAPPVEEVTPEVPPALEKPPVIAEERPRLEEAPPVEKRKAWYEKWWVWTAVGAVIAGVLTAIAINNRGEEEGPTGSATIVAPEP